MVVFQAGCQKAPAKYQLSWQRSFQGLGTSSSIRCADLTGDGILDVVLGAGRLEFQKSDSSIIAVDGKDGHVLWGVKGRDQMLGAASFLDINKDGTSDIVIGGRSAQLKAINGKSGDVIWSFEPQRGISLVRDYLRFNFYNAQLLADLDGDQIPEILVSNGGNVKAQMGSDRGRFPGVLAIFSGKTGQVIAADTLPDGKETYLSPLVHTFEGDQEAHIIFGSGGESRGGSLYKVPLSALLEGDISEAIPLFTEPEQGFIAPPILVNLSGDERREIVAITHNGKLVAFDSKEHRLIWKLEVPDYEANSTPSPGYYNQDTIPDLFISVSKGKWPDNTGQKNLIIDGKDGKVLFEEELGCFGFSSPLNYDLDGDGKHELIWSVNEYNCEGIYLADGSHYLYMKDLGNASQEIISPKVLGKNIATTAWIGDLDQDGFMDMVYCVQANTTVLEHYFGFQLIRSHTGIPVNDIPSWTEYMGPGGKGVF